MEQGETNRLAAEIPGPEPGIHDVATALVPKEISEFTHLDGRMKQKGQAGAQMVEQVAQILVPPALTACQLRRFRARPAGLICPCLAQRESMKRTRDRRGLHRNH